MGGNVLARVSPNFEFESGKCARRRGAARASGHLTVAAVNMPGKKGKGGKNRRRGKNHDAEKRELVFKEEGQEYAQILKMLGNGRVEAQCVDGEKRLCHIRGKLRKKVWINVGDIVLVGLRDFQDEKGDIILKYNPDECRSLKAYGELPSNIQVNEGGGDVGDGDGDDSEDYFDFDGVDDVDVDNI